jgi:phosphopantetheinyl transferase
VPVSESGPTVSLTVARFTEEERGDWLGSASSVLSEVERRQLNHIRTHDLRTGHAVGRAMLRLVGSRASGRHPRVVAVAMSEAGKPRLTDVPGLHASVAHTGRVVVVAATRAAVVGVDIESVIASTSRQRRLAARLFSDAEITALREVPDDALPDWFASAWTIKEAVGKAIGVGMIPALSGAIVERQADGFKLASVWAGPPAECWTLHQLMVAAESEKIAVALPVPGVALDPVTELTLEAFSEACRRADA